MKTDEIKLLYDYNYWADKRILATCAKVSQEQYVAPTSFGLGYGSLRATLIHILDSAWEWRLAFQEYFVAVDTLKESSQVGEPKLWNRDELTEADLPTLDVLEERWQTEEREMRAYLGSLTDQDLNGLVRYLIPGGIVRERVLWHCLLHVVNHGTQHRSEAAALLTSCGQSPGDLDFTAFLNEHFNLAS
jgi:uncharacterized damage-inducible protein DinB